MAHPAGADTATKFERTVLSEGFNDRLCDSTVAQGHAEAAFFCECGDPDCQKVVTLPIGTFNDKRAAWRPVLAEGHRLF